MSVLTFTEENYLKAIYSIQALSETQGVSVNEIAERMHTKPGTVTDMLRKLSEKALIHYEKYKKVWGIEYLIVDEYERQKSWTRFGHQIDRDN